MAREIIECIGQDPNTKENTIYSHKENVHDDTVTKCVNDFIEKILEENIDRIESYQTIHGEITELIYKSNITSAQRLLAFKSLNRISIDTATFTEKRISSADIFIHVWRLVKKYQGDDLELLKQRVIEELIDMADTCASGHAVRLINILSGYDVDIKISWKNQIHANMVARFQKKIKDIDDEDYKEKIIMGMMSDADPDDKIIYDKFKQDALESLKIELYDEFVTEGYVTSTEFNEIFDQKEL